MSDLFEQLKGVIDETAADVEKFYQKGNKAAGTRVRKAMQEVKRTAQDIRVDIQERKADM